MLKQNFYIMDYSYSKFSKWEYQGESDQQIKHRLRTEWLQSISKKKKGKK